jgi:hypothetical protein
MSCVDWQERIALHAGGDAAPGEAAKVERHLGECAGCRMLRSEMSESLAALREVHGELPDAAHFTAVRARVIGELERRRQVWRRLAWISGVAAMMAVLFVAWPRQAEIPPAPPRILASIPSAPLVRSMAAHPMPARVATIRHEKRTPLTIRLQTSDPNIVIYWIAE